MSAVPLVLKLTTQRTSHPQHSQVAELVDAMDGYSTMCKKAYSVCGHYNDSTTTGSSPVSITTTRYGNPTNTTSGPCSFF